MPRTRSGSASANRGSSATVRGNRRAPLAAQLGDHGGRFLVRLVLQQPGEEQVTCFEQREVLLVLDRRGRQQPCRLEVEQRRRDHEELADLIEVPVLAHGPDVCDEVVGHRVQRDLRDVELALADQSQQQVERSGEVVERDAEARGLLAGADVGGHCQDRQRCRSACPCQRQRRRPRRRSAGAVRLRTRSPRDGSSRPASMFGDGRLAAHSGRGTHGASLFATAAQSYRLRSACCAMTSRASWR